MQMERAINLPDIIRSSEPSVIKLRADNYGSLFDYAVTCATNYLSVCYPNQLGLAPVIASDLIDTRWSWKAADFINLFKFLRQRQDIEELRVFGNQLTMPKFMELVSVYENYRAMEFEKAKQEQLGQLIEQNKTLNPLAEKLALKMREQGHAPTGDVKLGREMDAQRARSEREGYGRNTTPNQNHNDFFEPKK